MKYRCIVICSTNRELCSYFKSIPMPSFSYSIGDTLMCSHRSIRDFFFKYCDFFSIFFLLSCVPSPPILWQNFSVQSRPGSLQLHNRDHAILGPAVVAMSARRGTAAKIRGPTFLLQLSYTHGRRDFPLLQFSVSGQRTTSTACRIAKKKAFALQGRRN